VLLHIKGRASDRRGAALMLPNLPPARELIADRGYDSARFRAELEERGIAPCIP
jgi:IS5 family transposase